MAKLGARGRYYPKRIDTSKVKLGEDILGLTERLAENNHDIWALQRIEEGWRHGPRRDDLLKEHPGLVPYARLAESEKVYDRNAAMETIKAMIALGYRIEKGGAGYKKLETRRKKNHGAKR